MVVPNYRPAYLVGAVVAAIVWVACEQSGILPPILSRLAAFAVFVIVAYAVRFALVRKSSAKYP